MALQRDLGAGDVAARLGMGRDERGWLAGLERVGPDPAGTWMPRGAELEATLARLGLATGDVADVAPAAPDPGRTPELWWLLERCAHRVVRAVGRWDDHTGPWPSLPAALGAAGRCFWLYAHLAALPAIRAWHRARGVPDDVSGATLADVGRQVADHRRRHGVPGFDAMRWISLHFRGALFALGRLQFNPYRLRTGPEGPLLWYEAPDPRAQEPGLRVGDEALAVHIPEAGPLTTAACDASLGAARAFFAAHFPEHRFRVATCTSWLLDDQLADHLPATSNIVRFQRRFELVPGALDSDDAFDFVFRRPESAIDQLAPRTTLERAMVGHVRGGRRWRLRTGWLVPPG